ncbi:MAG: hypothetical protein A2486_07135 [Burkholderiales bacterium RIFOXYC12_FULL_65_23]|nr:MAG: hypothetical protein A2486_07135 [Burkholderiales bacterium RIFOXYC12_FULL_65_23]
MGFGDLASFEFLQRAAKLFSNSSMVPTAYQAMVTKGYGKNQTIEANPAALSNCVVALDMAQRMNANPLMIMQNLHIIEGRPSWSSQFIIAAINGCGKFSPLRFDVEWMDEMDASYSTFEWVDGRKQELKHTIRIKNARCVAWALEKATGERLESAPVTMEMAVAEGWYGKNGSKWRSMPDLMLRYRSAAFFGRIYAPELLMGLPAAEELHDIIDVRQGADGKYVADLGDGAPQPAVKPAAPARPTLDFYPADRFAEKLPEWRTIVESGKKTPEDLIAMLSTKAVFSDEQRAILAGLGRAEEAQQAGGAPGIDPETGEVMQPDPEHDEFMRGLTGED